MIIKTENLDLFYGEKQILFDVNIAIPKNHIVAFIGPSGCGKSTLLRCFNRMNELFEGCRITGKVLLNGVNVNSIEDVNELRQKVGMVFQKPNPFPKSIFENVAFGLKIHKICSKSEIEDRVEAALKASALWPEVHSRLSDSALSLSGGQQQRLVIARALAIEPEVILLDEPASALDPISTSKIEELMIDLKKKYTVIVVTHNMQQALRIADKTAFLYLGKVVEYESTKDIFSAPKDKRTADYIGGHYG